MTKGIKVTWPGDNKKVDGIEFFYGIDIHNLDDIPEFRTVENFWPNHDPDTVEYNIDVQCERHGEREVHLVVTYEEAENPELSKKYPESEGYVNWGTSRIILVQGERRGRCEWRWFRTKKLNPDAAEWEAFDLGENSSKRELKDYVGSKRQAHFRDMILNRDRRCVLSKETSPQALEAAHLVPARNGENDIPSNGIALRADLHRLFDARLFTFRENGRVKITDPCNHLSPEYRKLLQSRPLPKATLERVRGTLALEQFWNR